MKKILTVDAAIELQQLVAADIEPIFHIIDAEREYLGRWLIFVEQTKSLADSQQALTEIIQTAARLNEYVFCIKFNRVLVGMIGMRYTDQHSKSTEVGYWLSQQYQKKGIVTKSLTKLIEFVFTELQLNRIQLKCASGNLPSIAVAKRLGFRLEGVEREAELLADGFTDINLYSLLKADWQP